MPRVSRRPQLLELAADLFAERGYANVSVDDLGDAAGISGPALYHHFASKEALLGEMLIGVSQTLLEGAKDAVSRSVNLLADLVAAHCEFAISNPSLITVQFRDLISATQHDQQRVKRIQGRYIAIWVDAVIAESPSLDPVAARAAVQAAFGLINSTPHSGKTLPKQDLASLLRSMALASLRSAQ